LPLRRPFDFATQTVDYGLAALLILFQESEPKRFTEAA